MRVPTDLYSVSMENCADTARTLPRFLLRRARRSAGGNGMCPDAQIAMERDHILTQYLNHQHPSICEDWAPHLCHYFSASPRVASLQPRSRPDGPPARPDRRGDNW